MTLCFNPEKLAVPFDKKIHVTKSEIERQTLIDEIFNILHIYHDEDKIVIKNQTQQGINIVIGAQEFKSTSLYEKNKQKIIETIEKQKERQVKRVDMKENNLEKIKIAIEEILDEEDYGTKEGEYTLNDVKRTMSDGFGSVSMEIANRLEVMKDSVAACIISFQNETGLAVHELGIISGSSRSNNINAFIISAEVAEHHN